MNLRPVINKQKSIVLMKLPKFGLQILEFWTDSGPDSGHKNIRWKRNRQNCSIPRYTVPPEKISVKNTKNMC